MMEITAKMVMELREKTGAGMMKCKEALQISKGNADDAVDYLRKKGLASADNKAGRATSQGVIVAAYQESRNAGAILELNCETDFVAKNDAFRAFSLAIVQLLIGQKTVKNVEDFYATKLTPGATVDETRKALVTKTGENMAVSRIDRFEIPAGKYGIVDAYVHGEDPKRLGVLVQLECSDPNAAKHEDLKTFAHEVALQICAMKPAYVGRKDVPSDALNREREVILGQIKNDPKNANKPENIMIKIVDGRLGKFYEEKCLLEQIYIRDEAKTKTIESMMGDLAKKLGGTIEIKSFRRWAIGDAPAAS